VFLLYPAFVRCMFNEALPSSDFRYFMLQLPDTFGDLTTLRSIHLGINLLEVPLLFAIVLGRLHLSHLVRVASMHYRLNRVLHVLNGDQDLSCDFSGHFHSDSP
jgi:hypothetical protein